MISRLQIRDSERQTQKRWGDRDRHRLLWPDGRGRQKMLWEGEITRGRHHFNRAEAGFIDNSEQEFIIGNVAGSTNEQKKVARCSKNLAIGRRRNEEAEEEKNLL